MKKGSNEGFFLSKNLLDFSNLFENTQTKLGVKFQKIQKIKKFNFLLF